jgi:cation:H+ antiporter
LLEIWALLFGGLTLLIVGGELLVRGAVQVASRLGISPLVIGLTLVGFGTSTPELVTSIQAILTNAPGIAYGNIVGSNIANILLIGGLAATLYPISVAPSALRRDGVFMLAVTAIFAALPAFEPMGQLIGAVFVAALILYIYVAFRQERAGPSVDHGALFEKSQALQQADKALAPLQVPPGPVVFSVLIAIGGICLVLAGGHLLVNGAVALARDLGISETVIGLTIVAIGTSMPELATSVIAALRRQSDVAFGNIVGSNIYNILGIGGAFALVAPGAIPDQLIRFDNLAMISVSLIFVAFTYTGFRVGRREGICLLAGYGVYLYIIWP